ncbi:hypothetical protein BROC_01297 [Candidatus Brocadiaceae bacterium]|nr:hypothetical protein BROC_01297 [Candidatus Brocadiaceae bacterium]
MAVFIVTGKLGSGKTLLACMKAQEYLKRKAPIASNIDFNLESICRPSNNYSRFIRLPDMPTADDMTALGLGCPDYNEEKFGAIFLDEAGIWLSSRKWNSSGRTDLLEFFLYLRKRRWDLWLIVQNIDIIDKVVRAAIAEHVVYCSRSDRFQMPIIPKLILNVVTVGLINLVKMPKFHSAICKYGVSAHSPVADTWYYRGQDYYQAYNTSQEFDPNYSSGLYSVLPPAYTLPIRKIIKNRYRDYLLTLPSAVPRKTEYKKRFMKLTKIYFRKFRFYPAFVSGVFVSVSICFAAFQFKLKPDILKQYENPITKESNNNFSFSSFNALTDGVSKPAEYKPSDLSIVSFSQYPGHLEYKFKAKTGSDLVSSSELISNGYQLIKGDRYHVQFKAPSGAVIVFSRV